MIFKGGCTNPLAIQAFVKSTGENALNARQVFETFDPDKGLVCKDSDQVSYFLDFIFERIIGRNDLSSIF